MGAVRGKDFKFYYDSNIPYISAAVWVELTDVKDVTRNLETALADASTRGSDFRQQIGTLKDLSIDFQMVYDGSDTGRQVFEDAYYLNQDIDVLFLDGSINTTGSKGIRFLCQVSKFGQSEGLEDVGMNDITIVPSYTQTDKPRRVHVATPGSVVDS